MNKKILIDSIGILLIALVVLVGYKLSPMLLPTVDVNIPPDPACNLQYQACAVSLPEGGRVELEMGTRPVPAMVPFDVQVRLEGLSASRIEVDFSGIEMNMGLIRPELITHGGGTFHVRATLPVCLTGAMDWQVTVLLEAGRKRIAIPFKLTTREPH